MKIPKLQYELYYPLYTDELIKLNLTECKNTNLEISIPVKLTDDLEKHNSSSNYYNNVCIKTTSESGTDISLKDRKNDFIKKNMTLCEEDCHLIEYNYTTEKAKCSCLIRINMPLIEDIKFDKDKLKKNFININNIANLKVLACYKQVFKLVNLLKNYGFFIYASFILIFFITLVLFCCKYFFALKKLIIKISDAKKNLNRLEKSNKNKDNGTKTLFNIQNTFGIKRTASRNIKK